MGRGPARSGPSIFQMMGRGPARPIKFLDSGPRGPAHHIFEFSRAGPDHRSMTSPFSFLFFLLCFTADAAVPCLSNRASRSQALYVLAAPVQQQSHTKFVCLTYVCWHCICVGGCDVCAIIYLNMWHVLRVLLLLL